MYHYPLKILMLHIRPEHCDLIKSIESLEQFTHKFTVCESLPDSIEAYTLIFFGMSDELIEERGISALLDELHQLNQRRKRKSFLSVFCDHFELLEEHYSCMDTFWPSKMSVKELDFRYISVLRELKRVTDLECACSNFQAVSNATPNLVWFKDINGIHTGCNDSFCQTVNKSREEVLGKDHYEIWDVSKEDPSNAKFDCSESENEVITQKKTMEFEEVVRTGHTSKIFTTYKTPLFNFDGSVMGTAGIGIDITKERKYEKEIIQKNHAFETIFSAVDCGIICHSLDGSRILSCNQMALNILGYETTDQMIQDGFNGIAQTVIPEDRGSLREALAKVSRIGDTANVEYRVLHPDRKLIHIMGTIKMIEHEGVFYYQRFLIDCTEQKKQERDRLQHTNELINALGSSFLLVFSLSMNSRNYQILRCSDSFMKHMLQKAPINLTTNEDIKLYIENFVDPEDREIIQDIIYGDLLEKELPNNTVFFQNFRLTHPKYKGNYLLKAVKVGDWNKKHREAVVGIQNVDQEMHYQMEQKQLLEDALSQARAASQAKSVFLSNMSHDIRTPMNAILGFASLALSHLNEKDTLEGYLEKIETSGKHLLKLINDILDMSSIENGSFKLEETRCSLNKLIGEVADIAMADASRKNQTFHLDVPDCSAFWVVTDRLKINQVLINVLSNAVKYTPENGMISLSLRIGNFLPPDQAEFIFEITDTGIGMSKSYLEHIFELFSRERTLGTNEVQGTGLGMAISKNIIDMMNGTIEVESEPGKGTKVTILLPMHVENRVPEYKDVLKPTIDTLWQANPSASRRILLVEDNEFNQEIASVILEDAGFIVECADNGAKAVDLVKNAPFGYYSIVLMDIQMPVLNGYQAAMKIRSLEGSPNRFIPILAMTANAFEQDRQEALKSGMNGHIAKPIDTKVLFETLHKILPPASDLQITEPCM